MSRSKNNKKNLLGESVTTRFMGLAGIGALSKQFVNKKYGKDSLRESSKVEELEEVITDDDLEGRQTEKGARLAETPEEEMEVGSEEAMDDMDSAEDMDMEEPVASGVDGGVDVESLVSALADVIQTHTGVPVDVEGEASSEEEMPVDDMEMGGEEEMPVDDMEMGDEEEMLESSEALARAGYSLDEKTGKYYLKKDKGKMSEVKKDKKEGGMQELDEEAQDLKSQMPNQPGKVKSGKTERVDGVKDPEAVDGSHSDHVMKDAVAPNLKTLEERVMNRVLTKLKEELSSRKASLKKKK